MPRILDRYVLREVTPPFLMGVVVFTFFLVIDRIYQLTDLVITKGVPFHLVLGLLLFMLPTFLSLTLPMALLVAVLLACGRLGADLELVALRACGVSPLRVLRPFLATAVVVATLAAGLTLAVAPWASGAFQKQLFKILQTRASTGLKERTFSGSFGQFTIYVQEISPSQVALRGLLVSDERNPALSRVIVAQEGRLLTDEENRRITLRFIEGQVTETDAAERQRSRVTTFSLYDMILPLDSPLVGTSRFDKPERDLPLGELLRRSRAAGTPGVQTAPFRVELHKRFALPLAGVVFVLVGFPLGLRTQRGGRGAALGLSLLIVVVYYLFTTSMENLALKDRLPAWVAMWVPNLLFGVGGLAGLVAQVRPVPRAVFRPWWRLRNSLAPAAEAARRLRLPRPPALPWRRRASTYVIDRYLLREYAKLLAAGLLVGAVVFVVVDLLNTLDRFLRVKPPLHYVFQHFAYHLPAALYQGLPIIVLMATVFLFISLTRAHELDALKAAGVSLYRVSVPVLTCAVLVSLGAGLFQETLLPVFKAKAEEVDEVKIRGGRPRHLQRRNQLWYRSSETRFFRMDLLDPISRSVDGLIVLEVDPSFRLVSRLDARQARWSPKGWELLDGVSRELRNNQPMPARTFRRQLVQMPEEIADFTRVQKPPDAMSFRELRSYVTRLQETGHEVGKYIVDLHAKLSFPLVHAIMALVAIPFALVSPRSAGRAMGVAVAIAIAVGYWVVHSMAIAFARADLLPPLLAAWTANIVFAGVGTALLLRART